MFIYLNKEKEWSWKFPTFGKSVALEDGSRVSILYL